MNNSNYVYCSKNVRGGTGTATRHSAILYDSSQFKQKHSQYIALAADLSPRRPGFSLRTVHVEFFMHNVDLGPDFLPVLRFSPVSTIPPTLYIRLRLNATVPRRAKTGNLLTKQ